MSNKFSLEKMKEVPIIGIIRGVATEKIPGILELYRDVGFTTIEITMNTDGAKKIIREIAQSFGSDMNVGAGTVCDMKELDDALDAGAQFIVTPIFKKDIIKACNSAKVPIFPGAYTPTEVYNAWEAGATAVKIFPTATGGIGHIKAIKAPLDHIPLIPTGGVNADNLVDFLDLGVYALGIGSHMFPKSFIEDDDMTGLRGILSSFKKTFDVWSNRQMDE